MRIIAATQTQPKSTGQLVCCPVRTGDGDDCEREFLPALALIDTLEELADTLRVLRCLEARAPRIHVAHRAS